MFSDLGYRMKLSFSILDRLMAMEQTIEQEIATAAKNIVINLSPKPAAISNNLKDLDKSSTELAQALNKITIAAVIVAVLALGWDIVKTLFLQ